jgi:DNA-binding ferritin-like protein (Dps family)
MLDSETYYQKMKLTNVYNDFFKNVQVNLFKETCGPSSSVSLMNITEFCKDQMMNSSLSRSLGNMIYSFEDIEVEDNSNSYITKAQVKIKLVISKRKTILKYL